MIILYIALGGAIGSVMRYGTVITAGKLLGNHLPYGTFIANILGSIIMGLFIGYFTKKDLMTSSEELRAFLTVGLLGGYTTFSGYSLDAFNLWQQGNFTNLVAYILLSVIIAILGLYAGYNLIK